MICYVCRSPIPEDQPFYNDYEQFVCKPCFRDARRCWICRFPGKAMEEVEGLGPECEFCRGNLIGEGDDPAELIAPAAPFLANYGLAAPERAEYEFVDRVQLREMQTSADVPQEEFIDDFLQSAYPVFYGGGKHHCLRRMTRPTLIVYGIVQLAAASVCERAGVAGLRGDTPFHVFCRGYCHLIGFEAAERLNFELERRQLRKWPGGRLQGDFENWRAMARFRKPAYLAKYFRAHLASLALKHLNHEIPSAGEPKGDQP